MKQLLHMFFNLYYFSFLPHVHAFVYINDNGVKFMYAVDFQCKCHKNEDVVSILKGVALARCVEECGLRKHCASLNYKRLGHVCELFTTADQGLEYTKGCLFLPASDITIDPEPCANLDCSNERACDISTDTCTHKECMNDMVLLNGEIQGNMKKVGSKIKYKCNDALTVRDNQANAKCLANGQWSHAAECVSACGDAPSITNGNVNIDSTDLNQAFITCDPGYRASPSSTINCVQGSNSWGSPSCELIVCGLPDVISNGNIALTVPGSYNYEDTALVTCSAGYETNVNLIRCKIDGDWEIASCERITCGNLPTIANGVASLSVPGASQYQDTAVVTCDAWFQPSVSLITCTASGNWNQASCTDVMCYPGTPWEYQGQVSVTVSGKTCQRWDQNDPHFVWETDLQYFPENTLSDANNYCRNPEANPHDPWCYTTDPGTEWEYCTVVPC